MTDSKNYIRWFNELSIDDVSLVGDKNASLGEIYQHLTTDGVRVPNGFAVTAKAYNYVLEYNKAWPLLHEALDGLDPNNIKDLQFCSKKARTIVLNCKLPDDLKLSILRGYAQLKQEYREEISLAVRSSATAEDSPDASFTGQNDSYLNISGNEALLDAYQRCLASNFTDRSIYYKYDNHFDFYNVFLSVVVMKMVRSDMGSSGVMFSLDTETAFKDVVFINAALGLGENIVQGTIEPDSFYVNKSTFNIGYRTELKRRLGKKELKMIFTDSLNTNNISVKHTANIKTSVDEREHFCIPDADVMMLADYAIKVEQHYSQKAGFYKPMDMEWAKDGVDGLLYIVQARPETVSSDKSDTTLEIYHLKETPNIISKGQAVGNRLGSGNVRVNNYADFPSDFQAAEALVFDATTLDWEPIIKFASAIVTNRGGSTCLDATVNRELGIPVILGINNANEILSNSQVFTMSGVAGEFGNIYDGILDFEIEQTYLSQLAKPKTQIMLNLGSPEQAFSLASILGDGFGLARMEFIINEYIKVHPMAFKHPEKIDESTPTKNTALCNAYKNQQEFFIRTLSEAVATISSSVYPKPSLVDMSNSKNNKKATLLGDKIFEPQEDNLMINFR